MSVPKRILERFSKSPSALSEDITAAEQVLGIALPQDYKELMSISNGLEGFVSPGKYVMLFPVTKLAEINVAADVRRYAPGFVIFGSDGSGRSFAFDSLNPRMPIVEFEDSEMSREAAEIAAENVTMLLTPLSTVD